MAAGPVSRILSATRMLRDGHSSRPHITARLKRPTRRCNAPSRHASRRFRRFLLHFCRTYRTGGNFLPIWSCSVWGLPCPPHHCDSGALLPHLFTLTPPIRKSSYSIGTEACEWAERYVFCGTFRQPGLNPASRTLSGTLLFGVRTFLYHPRRMTATVRPSCQPPHYIRSGSRLQTLGRTGFAIQ